MPANYKPFDKEEWLRLEKKADELRRLTIQTAIWGGSGHLGGALSAMDAMTILYHRFMKLDVNNPELPDRDRFVLSKGHAAVGYAPVICDYGFMPIDELKIFNLTGAKIGMHLDCNKVKAVDKKFEAFGFNVIRVDGHNFKELNDAIESAVKNHQNGGDKPTAIVMDTFKGEGVDFMKDNYLWHYGSLDEEKTKQAYASLDAYYKERCERAEKEA